MSFKMVEIVLMALVGLFSAVLGVIWLKADRAERRAEGNNLMLTHLAQHLDKAHVLTERLSALESVVSVEIKNISVTLRRLEAALCRRD